MITHHLSDECLLEYAAGSLPEAESLVVASHLAMCSDCREQLELLEEVGAVLLEDGGVENVPSDSYEAVMAKIVEPFDEERVLEQRRRAIAIINSVEVKFGEGASREQATFPDRLSVV